MKEKTLQEITTELQTLCHHGYSQLDCVVLDSNKEKRIKSIKVSPNRKIWIEVEKDNDKV